jgi:hypothetical protein
MTEQPAPKKKTNYTLFLLCQVVKSNKLLVMILLIELSLYNQSKEAVLKKVS